MNIPGPFWKSRRADSEQPWAKGSAVESACVSGVSAGCLTWVGVPQCAQGGDDSLFLAQFVCTAISTLSGLVPGAPGSTFCWTREFGTHRGKPWLLARACVTMRHVHVKAVRRCEAGRG